MEALLEKLLGHRWVLLSILAPASVIALGLYLLRPFATETQMFVAGGGSIATLAFVVLKK